MCDVKLKNREGLVVEELQWPISILNVMSSFYEGLGYIVAIDMM